MSFDRGNEVTGYNSGTLVNKLVEGVLPVGTGFTPDNGTRAVVNLVTGPCDVPKNKID